MRTVYMKSLAWLGLLALMFALPACPALSPGLEYTRNLTYAQGYVAERGGGYKLKNLKLDVIAAAEPGTGRTPVLLVHGGYFEEGSRRNERLVALADAMALRGYVCFLMDYRLKGDNPPAPAPYDTDDQLRAGHAAVVDVKAAMRYIRAEAAAHGVDSTRLVLLGESAGAVAALGAGLSDTDQFTNDGAGFPVPEGNRPGTDFQPSAIADLWGTARPFDEVFNAGDPPIFIAHGVLDTTIPVLEATHIAELCESAGIPFELRLFLFEQHGAWDGSIGDKDLTTLILEFLEARVPGKHS